MYICNIHFGCYMKFLKGIDKNNQGIIVDNRVNVWKNETDNHFYS